MASDLQIPLPGGDFGALIRDLRSGLRQVLSALEKVVEKIEEIEKRLKDLENGGVRGPLPPGAPRFVYNIDILPSANGSRSFEVSVDGKEGFFLGPRLAGLLEFIASGERDRNAVDPLVGWRSWEELTSLKDSAGKGFRRAYVNTMVNLLRDTLLHEGFSRDLIQTNKEKGVRLRLKHSSRGPRHALIPGL
jgi:hypothetical protein